MNNAGREWVEAPVDRVLIVVIGVVLIVGFATLGDYGVTTDETLRMRAAQAWWGAIRDGEVASHVAGTRANYGVLFDQLGRIAAILDHHIFGSRDPFRARHVLCFLTGVAGLVGTYALARRLSSRTVAVLAVVLLATTPRVYGSMFANPKDIPFMTTVVWAMLATVRAIQQPSMRSTVLVAIACALCTAIRPLGAVFFVLGALGIVAPVLRWDRQYGWAAMARARRRAAVQVTIFFVLAYALVFILWPVLWVRPPWHLWDASQALTRHIRGSRSLLLGELHPFDDAPGYYVVAWLGATLPCAVLIPGLIGLVERSVAVVHASRQSLRATLPWALVLGWVVGPTVIPMLTRVTLYDAARQLTFMAPALAILAAHALVTLGESGVRALPSHQEEESSARTESSSSTLRHPLRRSLASPWRAWARPWGRAWGTSRVLKVALVALGIGEAATRMVLLHPYQTLYFNPLVGGIQGAQERFDVAHYSETYAEGFAWLAEHAQAPVDLHVVGNGSTTASYLAYRHGMSLNRPRFGYFLSEVRQGWASLLPGKIVHRIEREGVPLLEIRKVDPMTATSGGYLWQRENASAGWQPWAAQEGQFFIADKLRRHEPAWIAVPLEATSRTTARVYASFYWGAKITLVDPDGTRTLLYDAREVPYHYRATEFFPSLVPLDVPLIPGTQWIIIEVTRVRPDWHVGFYAPASERMTWGTRPPFPSLPPIEQKG